jgi:hypothetical protein
MASVDAYRAFLARAGQRRRLHGRPDPVGDMPASSGTVAVLANRPRAQERATAS